MLLIELGMTECVYQHDALLECNKKCVVYNEYNGGKYPAQPYLNYRFSDFIFAITGAKQLFLESWLNDTLVVHGVLSVVSSGGKQSTSCNQHHAINCIKIFTPHYTFILSVPLNVGLIKIWWYLCFINCAYVLYTHMLMM